MNQIIKLPVILCFADYYLPGYRSGGPVRSISNFVDYFGDEYDIHIITRDRDFLDSDSYLGISIDRWNRVGKANVFYASNRFLSLWGIARLLRNTTHDILYKGGSLVTSYSCTDCAICVILLRTTVLYHPGVGRYNITVVHVAINKTWVQASAIQAPWAAARRMGEAPTPTRT